MGQTANRGMQDAFAEACGELLAWAPLACLAVQREPDDVELSACRRLLVDHSLAELCRVIAASGASIKDIAHDRAFSGADVSAVNAVCTVETRDRAHITTLHRALRRQGFPLTIWK